MKKINITLVALLTALSLTGCGVTISIDTGKDNKKTTEQAETETKEIEQTEEETTDDDFNEDWYKELEAKTEVSEETEDSESSEMDLIDDFLEENYYDDMEFYWPEIGIATKLPSVDWFLTGQVHYNFDNCLSADIAHVSKDQFREYVKLCYEAGYTDIDVNTAECYIAYDDNGVCVYLEYFEDMKVMTIYTED